MPSQQWNLALTTTCCVLLGAVFGASLTAIAWGQPSAIGDFIWRWQTIVSASVAGCAALIAWKNVSRQLRLTTLMREEDRIEESLPGLRQVSRELQALLHSLKDSGPVQFAAIIESNIHIAPGESVIDAVNRDMPLANINLQRSVAGKIASIYYSAVNVKKFDEDIAKWSNLFRRARDKEGLRSQILRAQQELRNNEAILGAAFAALRDEANEISARIKRAERRLPLIRQTIDNHIGDS